MAKLVIVLAVILVFNIIFNVGYGKPIARNIENVKAKREVINGHINHVKRSVDSSTSQPTQTASQDAGTSGDSNPSMAEVQKFMQNMGELLNKKVITQLQPGN